MPNSRDDERRINAIRFLAVDAVQKANSGHPGMPLGAAAFTYTLWTRHLRFDPAEPDWFDRDRFVLSAGHGSMLLYALLYLTGYAVSMNDLKSFRQFGSLTPGHPEFGHTPGVSATTGPLGQGVGNAVGMAIAQAHLAARFNRDARIVEHFTYCICGDGDLMEGISQEALSLAGHLRLGKLILLYDDNQVSLAGPTEITLNDDVLGRFEASGWHVQRVTDGNDVAAVDGALTAAKNVTDRPSLLALRTHIGYGSPEQDSFKAHGEPLGPENVAKTKERLGWPLTPAFEVPDDVLAFFREVGRRGGALNAQWQSAFQMWEAAHPDLAEEFQQIAASKPTTSLAWPQFDAANGSVATRDAGGLVMNAIAASLPELIGGSADLDPSTKTYLHGAGDFEPGSYEGRNIHFGVREHAMGAIANGIAYHGSLLPFTATFFNFSDYM
ncbi:MAG: transketolase family protein, partial [Vulcanimicrobiaceae bacterium]